MLEFKAIETLKPKTELPKQLNKCFADIDRQVQECMERPTERMKRTKGRGKLKTKSPYRGYRE